MFTVKALGDFYDSRRILLISNMQTPVLNSARLSSVWTISPR